MSVRSRNLARREPSLSGRPADAFRFGGLELTPLDRCQAAGWVLERARSELPAIVVTSHIYHLMMARRDVDFRAAVAGADLNVADGWPLVAASRILRPSLPGRVPGIDLVADVLAAPMGLRVAILGGPGDSAARLGDRLADPHRLVFTDPLPPGAWATEAALAELEVRLREGRPNLVLIGLGAPQQELLAVRLRAVVPGPIIACGATIEVLAGDRRRAPRPLQTVGLEWAFRMAMEPRRLAGRYARAGVWFGAIAVLEVLDRFKGLLDAT